MELKIKLNRFMQDQQLPRDPPPTGFFWPTNIAKRIFHICWSTKIRFLVCKTNFLSFCQLPHTLEKEMFQSLKKIRQLDYLGNDKWHSYECIKFSRFFQDIITNLTILSAGQRQLLEMIENSTPWPRTV